MKKTVYVIDTSGFIAGAEFIDGPMFTVPGVVDEIVDKHTRLRFDLLVNEGLKVELPLKIYHEKVRFAAISTGDNNVLSKTDVDILAKALELNEECSVVMITDDYAIQNVAASLGIKYKSSVSKGIKSRIRWELKCIGCGAAVKSGNECPICGSGVTRHRVEN